MKVKNKHKCKICGRAIGGTNPRRTKTCSKLCSRRYAVISQYVLRRFKRQKMKTHHAKTVDEAFDNYLQFWSADLDYCFIEEWKTWEDAWKDIKAHTEILRKEVKGALKNQ